MLGLRLYKIEKLRSEIAIGQLFDRSNPAALSVMAYPLRAVWRVNTSRKSASCPQFLIAVPKKKLRHAVDRVYMRRRIREAYRLNRHLIPRDLPLDIAFVYVASELKPYAAVERSVVRILSRIGAALAASPAEPASPAESVQAEAQISAPVTQS
ncbi:MAG: ribonuclease P protein component [Duncaniella sp.]|nr:ribonuclease P protein component [Duncaniella sp.]